MHLSTSTSIFQFAALAAAYGAFDESPSSTTHVAACTATSSSGSGAFFDLRPDTAIAAEEDTRRFGVAEDYYARGWDYGKNFTLNICGAVVDPVSGVVGLTESAWANVSAYYTSHNSVYSIGSQSMDLVSRGRKLVLQYTGGSPCGESSSDSDARYANPQYAEDDDDSSILPHPHEVESIGDASKSDGSGVRRKSTTISFICDRDPGVTHATVNFIGTDPDECAYFFDVRSVHACAHAEPHKPGSVGPGSIFGLILMIALLVYVLGGIFYNRTVAHARGWRQIPNYSLWAGIWSFICDMLAIGLSSCSRFLPSRRGYSHLNSSPSGRNRNAEAENRLIDQLDEEWDD